MLTPVLALRPNHMCQASIRWLRHPIACAKISAKQEIQGPFSYNLRLVETAHVYSDGRRHQGD
jgi:hypothetical protein